jgi:hypothetical protein
MTSFQTRPYQVQGSKRELGLGEISPHPSPPWGAEGEIPSFRHTAFAMRQFCHLRFSLPHMLVPEFAAIRA